LKQWVTDKKADGLRPATIKSYEWLINTHIVPTLGDTRLDRLTPTQIRTLITAKSQSSLGRASGTRWVGWATRILGPVLRLAYQDLHVAAIHMNARFGIDQHEFLNHEYTMKAAPKDGFLLAVELDPIRKIDCPLSDRLPLNQCGWTDLGCFPDRDLRRFGLLTPRKP
jgi:Phage integrase, N-terminal SAM-like domain